MDEQPESPVGVYSNLCVTYSNVHQLQRGLRPSDTVLPLPEGPGVALGGDSRMSPAPLDDQTPTNLLTPCLLPH